MKKSGQRAPPEREGRHSNRCSPESLLREVAPVLTSPGRSADRCVFRPTTRTRFTRITQTDTTMDTPHRSIKDPPSNSTSISATRRHQRPLSDTQPSANRQAFPPKCSLRRTTSRVGRRSGRSQQPASESTPSTSEFHNSQCIRRANSAGLTTRSHSLNRSLHSGREMTPVGTTSPPRPSTCRTAAEVLHAALRFAQRSHF